jgi:aryl-alcohol dehydrogenase-like predicted oxidoreductase
MSASTPITPTAALADATVHRVGLGLMQLAPHRGPGLDHDAAVAFLRAAAELGVDHFDTAEFYGAGRANRALADAFGAAPEAVVIATKVGAREMDGALVAAQHPDELRADVEANLASLGAERVDVVYLRRLDTAPGIIAAGEQRVDLDAQLAELSALRDAGKIGAIALSNVDAAQVDAAAPTGIAAVQNAYNLIERDAEPVLAACRAHDVAWVPFFPLGSGFPDIPKVTEHPEVIAAAAQLGATAGQVGLAWLLAHDEHTLLIPGTRSLEHLRENVEAASLALPDDVVARLDGIAAT